MVNLQAIQFVFDTEAPEEDRLSLQANLNQAVANGFRVVACPVVGTKVFYQLVGEMAIVQKGKKK